jgi:histidine triad (HIT) family protein
VEIVRRYDQVFVKMNPRGRPHNRGAALVIPNQHHENVFDLPPALGADLQQAVRDTALAMKAGLGCDGITIRQHNEPAGSQDVWHFHIHVIPRYHGDDLTRQAEPVEPERLRHLAEQLRAAWPGSAG